VVDANKKSRKNISKNCNKPKIAMCLVDKNTKMCYSKEQMYSAQHHFLTKYLAREGGVGLKQRVSKQERNIAHE
jgi:hypothetical protein